MSPMPITIGDFMVLPVSIPPLPSFPVSAIHHIYLRQNKPRSETDADFKTLFLANVPVDSTEAHFRELVNSLIGPGKFLRITFEEDGKALETAVSIEPGEAVRLARMSRKRKLDEVKRDIQDQQISQLPSTWSRKLRKSGSTAVVQLADEPSVGLVLKAVAKVHKTRQFPIWGEGLRRSEPPLGAEWLHSHNQLSYPNRERVEQAIDKFFVLFNKKEKAAAELAKRMRNQPDEDGFFTVTRGGRNAPASTREAEAARQRMLDKQQKKKEDLTDFYRFQRRERMKAGQEERLRQFKQALREVDALRQKKGKLRPEK